MNSNVSSLLSFDRECTGWAFFNLCNDVIFAGAIGFNPWPFSGLEYFFQSARTNTGVDAFVGLPHNFDVVFRVNFHGVKVTLSLVTDF